MLDQPVDPLCQGVELSTERDLGQRKVLVFQRFGEPPVFVQQLLRPAMGFELGDGIGERLQEPLGGLGEFASVAHRTMQIVQDAFGDFIARQTTLAQCVGVGKGGQPQRLQRSAGIQLEESGERLAYGREGREGLAFVDRFQPADQTLFEAAQQGGTDAAFVRDDGLRLRLDRDFELEEIALRSSGFSGERREFEVVPA